MAERCAVENGLHLCDHNVELLRRERDLHQRFAVVFIEQDDMNVAAVGAGHDRNAASVRNSM